MEGRAHEENAELGTQMQKYIYSEQTESDAENTIN
jgi:hypothetical protein